MATRGEEGRDKLGGEDTLCCSSVAQSYQTLCDPMGCSPPGSSVRGILQERILEWVAMPFSRGPSLPRDRAHGPCVSGSSLTTEPPGKPASGGVFLLAQTPHLALPGSRLSPTVYTKETNTTV